MAVSLCRANQAAPAITPFELGYSVRSWTSEDGLLGTSVSGIAQGSDGALLFSDGEAVIRYNGIEFEPLANSANELPILKKVNSLWEDKQGRIWTSGLVGQARLDPGDQFRRIGEKMGGRAGVGFYAEGPDGRVDHGCAVSEAFC